MEETKKILACALAKHICDDLDDCYYCRKYVGIDPESQDCPGEYYEDWQLSDKLLTLLKSQDALHNKPIRDCNPDEIFDELFS